MKSYYMKIEKVTLKSIKKAIEILQSGGTVVYPTETAYGLGCDSTNQRASQKIFKIKKRSKEKQMPVICAHKTMVAQFFKVNKIVQELALKYWPGPFTIIMESGIRNQELGERAVRVSSNNVARTLSRGLGKPIISTSANISGEAPAYNIKEVIKSFARKKYIPDLILDAGKLPKRPPSTIVKIIQNGEIVVIREGEIRIN